MLKANILIVYAKLIFWLLLGFFLAWLGDRWSDFLGRQKATGANFLINFFKGFIFSFVIMIGALEVVSSHLLLFQFISLDEITRYLPWCLKASFFIGIVTGIFNSKVLGRQNNRILIWIALSLVVFAYFLCVRSGFFFLPENWIRNGLRRTWL